MLEHNDGQSPSNKDRLTATSSWPIVSMANLVRHTKRLSVPQGGLVEEAEIYVFLENKLDQFLPLTANTIDVPVGYPQSLPVSLSRLCSHNGR